MAARGRHPRRRPRARPALRGRRQARQDDPRTAPPATFKQAMSAGSELLQPTTRTSRSGRSSTWRARLEGLNRNDSIHAAGVVIATSRSPSTSPAAEGRGRVVTQFAMETSPRPRPAQDGLPRAAQPRRDRSTPSRSSRRRAAWPRHRHPAARRPEDLQDARPRRVDRRLPARGSGHARGCCAHAPDGFEDVIAIVALYRPGPIAVHRRFARNKQDRSRSPTTTSPASRSCSHQRRDRLPGAVHGHRPAWPASRSARPTPAQGDQQEEGESWRTFGADSWRACAASGIPRKVAATSSGATSSSPGLRLQQEPRRCYALISLPHRVAEGQLPGRVHGGARHERVGDQDKVPYYVDQCHGWASRSCRPTSTRATRLHGGRRADPLRAQRREGRGRGGAIEAIISARAPAAFASSSTSAARRLDRSTSGARGAHQERRLRLDRRHAARHATGLPAAMAAGERQRKDRAAGQGGLFDLARRRRRRPAAAAPARSRPPNTTATSCCASRKRRWASTSFVSSAQGAATPAARPDRCDGQRTGRRA